jgi:hypothetical protein
MIMPGRICVAGIAINPLTSSPVNFERLAQAVVAEHTRGRVRHAGQQSLGERKQNESANN